VFAAFATREAKAKWFAGPKDEWHEDERGVMEFRNGGREMVRGTHKGGIVSTFECRYYDIVENSRIVYAYEMHLNDTKISVSLATIEIKAEGTSCRLVLHEDGVFLDGFDDGGKGREQGTIGLMDQLVAYICG
jgi:uncharacterized protein YndB with AHSA1/START domain